MKDECSHLLKELKRVLVSGECKSFSQSKLPTLSTSAYQSKIEQEKGGPSSIDKNCNRLKRSIWFGYTVSVKQIF